MIDLPHEHHGWPVTDEAEQNHETQVAKRGPISRLLGRLVARPANCQNQAYFSEFEFNDKGKVVEVQRQDCNTSHLA